MKRHPLARQAVAARIALGGLALGLAALGAATLTAETARWAQNARPGLPEAAYSACADLTAGDACPITSPDGRDITGFCAATPDARLACMPEDAPAAPEAPDAPPPPRG